MKTRARDSRANVALGQILPDSLILPTVCLRVRTYGTGPYGALAHGHTCESMHAFWCMPERVGRCMCGLWLTVVSVCTPCRTAPLYAPCGTPQPPASCPTAPSLRNASACTRCALFVQTSDTYIYTFRHDADGWRCDANI